MYKKCSHKVDKNDIIIGVSENWRLFAEENFGGPKCFPENIVGTSLWDHICGLETKELYKIILQKVREHRRQVFLPYRCDSPEKRRSLKLTIIPIDDGSVEFISETIKEELREPVDLLRPNVERSNEFLRICSMCKKIGITDKEWEEVEIAVQKMKLFEIGAVPQLTHGLCHSCYQVAMAELERISRHPTSGAT